MAFFVLLIEKMEVKGEEVWTSGHAYGGVLVTAHFQCDHFYKPENKVEDRLSWFYIAKKMFASLYEVPITLPRSLQFRTAHSQS